MLFGAVVHRDDPSVLFSFSVQLATIDDLDAFRIHDSLSVEAAQIETGPADEDSSG